MMSGKLTDTERHLVWVELARFAVQRLRAAVKRMSQRRYKERRSRSRALAALRGCDLDLDAMAAAAETT